MLSLKRKNKLLLLILLLLLLLLLLYITSSMINELSKFLSKHDLSDIANSRSSASKILHVHPNDSLVDCLRKFQESNFSFLLICNSDHSPQNTFCFASHPTNTHSVQWLSLVDVLTFLFVKQNSTESPSDCLDGSKETTNTNTTKTTRTKTTTSSSTKKATKNRQIYSYKVKDCLPHWSSTILGEKTEMKEIIDIYLSESLFKENSINLFPVLVVDGIALENDISGDNEQLRNNKANDDEAAAAAAAASKYYYYAHTYHAANPILIKNHKILKVTGVITPVDLLRYFYLYSYPLSPLMDVSATKIDYDSRPLLVEETVTVRDTFKFLIDDRNPKIVGMTNKRGVLLDSFSIGTFLPLFMDELNDNNDDDDDDNAYSDGTETSTKKSSKEKIRNEDKFDQTLSQFFQQHPKCCNPCSVRYNDSLGALLQKLLKVKRHCVWRLDEWGRPMGVIYNIDLIRFIREQLKVIPLISL